MDKTPSAVSSFSEPEIQSALTIIEARLSKAEADKSAIERLIAATREEEQLLRRLLALRMAPDAARSFTSEAAFAEPPNANGRENPLLQRVVGELTTAGRPLHISELMRLLRTAGVVIPGSGLQANLITYMMRDSRIMRVSRGMYALSDWSLQSIPQEPVGPRRRKRARSVSRKSSKEN